jgi:hypothetical protein
MVVEVLFQEVVYIWKKQMSDPVKFKALVEAFEAHHVQISNVVTCAFTQHVL